MPSWLLTGVSGQCTAKRGWIASFAHGLTECVFGPDAPRPWTDVDELEFATLSWVHWFNEDRLHGHCKDVQPAEFEAAFYAAQQTDPAGVGIQ